MKQCQNITGPTSSSIVLPIAATKKTPFFWYTWSHAFLVPHFQIQEAASQPRSSSPGHGISWGNFSDTSSDWVHFNPVSIHFSWCINTKCYGNFFDRRILQKHKVSKGLRGYAFVTGSPPPWRYRWPKRGLAIANLRLIASGMCLVSLPTLQNHKLW